MWKSGQRSYQLLALSFQPRTKARIMEHINTIELRRIATGQVSERPSSTGYPRVPLVRRSQPAAKGPMLPAITLTREQIDARRQAEREEIRRALRD